MKTNINTLKCENMHARRYAHKKWGEGLLYHKHGEMEGMGGWGALAEHVM